MKTKSMLLGGIAALALGMGFAPPAAADDPNTLIVGGHPATESYEWMASLQQQGQHSCGASLIDDNWVLTAAHCVQNAQPSALNLRIGSPDHTTGGTEAGVAEIVVHPEYATQTPNRDIALIRLDRSVPQKPIAVAEASGQTGTPSRIIGWGLTCPYRGCGQPPTQLQELDTQVVADSDCSMGLVDNATEICTGPAVGSNACFGDSGGPQLEGTAGNWRLTGVTSRLGGLIPLCGTAPSIYTDATAYTDWIASHVS